MKLKNLSLYLFTLAFISVATSEAAAAPTGAVRLSKSKLDKKSGFYCGNVKGDTWVPGKLLSGGYFYSHLSEKSNLTKQLKSAPKKKKAKIQSQIDSLSTLISTRTSQCTGAPSGGKNALRFNFSGAVGLTLKEASRSSPRVSGRSSSKSNLQKVDSSGQVSSVVSKGSATISKFLIAPNDKLYVLFEQSLNLSDTTSSGKCLLAEVDRATGYPICIDDSLSSISWQEKPANDAIQFDATGAIYYRGNSSSGDSVLRKYSSGSHTDLINQNISISDFSVLPDGRVILIGFTSNTGSRWVRRVSTSGSLSTLFSNDNALFVKRFPDENVYVGIWGTSNFGVFRYLTATDSRDSQPYISQSNSPEGSPPTFDTKTICDGALTQLQGFCGHSGTYVRDLVTTASQKVYAVAGIAGLGTGVLMQYYPTLTAPSTAVKRVSVSQGVNNQIVLAGTNASGQNILTLFDTSDSSEIQLIGPDNEIEIYRLHYVASSNKIMFDGLRFSDNKYVIGQYDLNTMTFSAAQTGSTKLVDFQTF